MTFSHYLCHYFLKVVREISLAYIFSHREKQEHMSEPRFSSCVRDWQRGLPHSHLIWSTEVCCTTVGEGWAGRTAMRALRRSKGTQTVLNISWSPSESLPLGYQGCLSDDSPTGTKAPHTPCAPSLHISSLCVPSMVASVSFADG